MGCSASRNGTMPKRRSSSKVTIDSLESELSEYINIKKRYGHPTYYKSDGFEIGLRVKVKGQFQSIFVGTGRQGGEKVTIKEHHTVNCNESDVTNEIMIVAKLSHDCIPKLKDIFITNISVFMVTDFIDSMRLKHFVSLKNATTTLTVSDARKIIKSVISAVNHCHFENVIVRNITAESISVKREGKEGFVVQLADFSLAVPTDSIAVLCDHPLFDWQDVPYMAPEALLGHPYTSAMDVWSIGAVLYVMLCGELPFSSEDDKELVEKIKTASFEYSPSNAAWTTVDDKVRAVVNSLLVVPMEERPTAKELMKNPWILVG